MPTPVPQKLPEVTGSGSLAKGFRMVFRTVNALIECVESLQPRPGAEDEYFSHTGIGTTRKSRGDASGTSNGDGTARWA